MELKTALAQGTHLLENAGIASPRMTAEVLLMHAARCDRAHLHAHSERALTEVEWIHYGRYLSERLKGKPTQYITGRQEFWGLEFLVNPSVLIPRPETELVVEAALELARRNFSGHETLRIADVGTGSGCIAVALAKELPQATVYALDRSAAALSTARQNAARHGVEDRIRFWESDLLNASSGERLPSLELVVSNPPYVGKGDVGNVQREVLEHEPHGALFAGETGIEIYERLIAQAAQAVCDSGFLVLELGYDSEPWMRQRLAIPEWTSVQWRPDLAGITRVVSVRRAAREK